MSNTSLAVPWLAPLVTLLIVRRGRSGGRRRHAGIEPCHAQYVAVGEGTQPQEVPREAVVAAPGIAAATSGPGGIVAGIAIGV
jgi:hypothetical protein